MLARQSTECLPTHYYCAVSLARIEIDADISRARTLPSAVYHQRAWWYRQRERVFPYTWHLWPGGELPDASGQLVPWELLPDCVAEPLLLSRHDGGLSVLSNVCTHRGNVLVDEPCQVQGIRCRYHGRRFALDGRMLSMPEFEGVEAFPGPEENLKPIQTHQWAGMLFGALDPKHALDQILGPVVERVGHLPLEEAKVAPDDIRVYEFDANWALYCDNYLEGFHVPYVHPGLRGTLDYAAYDTTCFPGVVLQTGIASEGELSFDLPVGHVDHGRAVAGYYFWLFPCTMLNFYPWGISVNVVLPLGPTRTRVVFISRVWDPDKREQGAGAGLHQVEMEDEEVVMAVQKGVKAHLYDRGRYSPRRERGVHHFHRMLSDWLND